MTKFSKKLLIFLTAAIFFFGVFGLAKISQAATYYVATGGNDSTGTGTSSAPFKTIQKAADTAGAGDTVIVRDGVYKDTDSMVVRINKAGTSSAWITFKSEHKWGAKIDGNNNAVQYGVFFDTGAHYVRFEDFEIYGCKIVGIFANADSQTSPTAWAHHIYIYGNKIHDIARTCFAADDDYGKSGIDTDAPCNDITIDSNVIYHVGRKNIADGCSGDAGCNNDHAIYSRGHHSAIINNIMYENYCGQQVVIKSYECSGNFCGDYVDFVNNVIANPLSNTGCSVLAGVLNTDWGNDYVNIHNNIFYNCTKGAIYAYPHNAHTEDGCGQHSNINVKNNLVQGGPLFQDAIDPACQGAWIVSNNIIGQDPRFVNLALKDFHLQSSSPAINKGLAYSGRTVDADGKSIVGLPDLGAYEYGGGTSDTTAPAAPAGVKAN
jgi:hypothetical protein